MNPRIPVGLACVLAACARPPRPRLVTDNLSTSLSVTLANPRGEEVAGEVCVRFFLERGQGHGAIPLRPTNARGACAPSRAVGAPWWRTGARIELRVSDPRRLRTEVWADVQPGFPTLARSHIQIVPVPGEGAGAFVATVTLHQVRNP